MDTTSAMALTQTVVIYAAFMPDPAVLFDASTVRATQDCRLRLASAIVLSGVVGVGLAIMTRSWAPLVVTASASLVLGVSADLLIRAQSAERITSNG